LVAVGSIVQNVLDASPKTKYIIAVDDSNNTLEEITRVESLYIDSDSPQNFILPLVV